MCNQRHTSQCAPNPPLPKEQMDDKLRDGKAQRHQQQCFDRFMAEEELCGQQQYRQHHRNGGGGQDRLPSVVAIGKADEEDDAATKRRNNTHDTSPLKGEMCKVVQDKVVHIEIGLEGVVLVFAHGGNVVEEGPDNVQNHDEARDGRDQHKATAHREEPTMQEAAVNVATERPPLLKLLERGERLFLK